MFEKLLKYYLDYFQTVGEPALVTICNCKVPSDIILEQYKKLSPIEKLPVNEKNELWEYAKEKYPDGDMETRLRFIRITYTIGTLV